MGIARDNDALPGWPARRFDSGRGFRTAGDNFNQIGTRICNNSGWNGFIGQIADVRIWTVARTDAQVKQDRTMAPAVNEPGLEADYPLDDGQGLTAHDLTSNHNDGTLAGTNDDVPTWVGGEAIDLGQGIAYNATSPRQGANDLQNFPIIVTTAGGQLQGWLGGSTPSTTFRVDLFASAGFSAEGAGQAEDYLGSLDVTTDATGQVQFAVPFTAPAGLPIITATATDPARQHLRGLGTPHGPRSRHRRRSFALCPVSRWSSRPAPAMASRSRTPMQDPLTRPGA